MRIYCTYWNCSIQQIVKDKDFSTNVPVSSTIINKQIADYRQQTLQQFDIFKKTARSKVSDEYCTINNTSFKEFEHAWPVGDSFITGTDEKRLRENRLVKINDFRSAILADINHQSSPMLKEKPGVLILHVGTIDSVSRSLREIVDDLFQIKSVITKTLPTCKVILWQPTL